MMRERPLPVPIAASRGFGGSQALLRPESADGLEERAGDWARGEPWDRERGREDSGRLRRASAIADGPVRVWDAGAARRAGSSTVEIGDCTMDVPSLSDREAGPGASGEMRIDPDGMGLRLMELALVEGVSIDVSDELVTSDGCDALSGDEGGAARALCTAED